MGWHQNKAAAIFAFLAIAMLIVAATSSKGAVPGVEIVIGVSRPLPEGPSVSGAILANPVNTFTKAKAAKGAIWDKGPAYDLSSTGQASIYVYIP
jgi:hypothetical protein